MLCLRIAEIYLCVMRIFFKYSECFIAHWCIYKYKQVNVHAIFRTIVFAKRAYSKLYKHRNKGRQSSLQAFCLPSTDPGDTFLISVLSFSVCNFVVHDRCLKTVISPCSSIAAMLVKVSQSEKFWWRDLKFTCSERSVASAAWPGPTGRSHFLEISSCTVLDKRHFTWTSWTHVE